MINSKVGSLKKDLKEDSCKVWVSAKTGAGLDLLCEVIATQLHGAIIEEEVYIPPSEAKLRARLYQLGAVVKELLSDEGGWFMQLRLTAAQKQQLFTANAKSSPTDTD